MKILLLLITLLIGVQAYSQAPQSFKYQATARNSSGNLILNQMVGMQTSIIQGSANSSAVYVETFTPVTDEFGLINIDIGTGNTSKDFSAINWANGPYFIKIEMDITGGTSYHDFGTSQLLSVPYALFANNAATSNYSFSPSYPNGFHNITPITFTVSAETPYTVPNGKILYILNVFMVYLGTWYGELLINNMQILSGNFNEIRSDRYSLVLSLPIIVGENDIVSVSYNTKYTVNGYLVDK
jgi:opacity protein-like surface antigen